MVKVNRKPQQTHSFMQRIPFFEADKIPSSARMRECESVTRFNSQQHCAMHLPCISHNVQIRARARSQHLFMVIDAIVASSTTTTKKPMK